jgi:hypothetical protein
MKRIHPKLSFAAALAALAISATSGCKNPSSGVGNPFLAPGRVPPPATRALLPGEAQPYYPGDPLPVMQSRNAALANEPMLAAAETDAMPSASENLKWGAPKTAPEAIAAAPAAPPSAAAPWAQTVAAAPQPQRIAAAVPAPAEPTVAIPADGNSLRFAAAPPPEPQPFTPPAAARIPIQPAPKQFAAAPSPPSVVPASYTAPSFTSAEPPVPNPWRAPEVSPSALGQQLLSLLPPPPVTSMAPTAAAPAQSPITAPPLFAATNTMDVRLRAVPSPPVDSYSPTPRIRMPGYETAPYVSSNDGFRPRSSMR